MVNYPVKVGIVGAGIRGALYSSALASNPAAHVVAVCDPNPSVLDAHQENFGDSQTYLSVAELLENHPDLDAAIIATPDFAHRDAAVACAERGLDLMIEKPLATSVDDAQAIVDAAEASGSRIMMGFENRWHPKFAELHRLTAESAAVIAQTAQLNDTIFVPTSMLSWAARSSPAWFLMPHTLDLAVWLSGAIPVSVTAHGRRGLLERRGVDTWDAIVATFEMSDRSIVTLHSSWVLPESIPAVYEFNYEVQTENALFRVAIADQGVQSFTSDRAAWPQFSPVGPAVPGIAGAMVADFIRFVGGEDVAVPSHRDGMLITRAVEAVHHSLETRTTVKIHDS